LSQSRGSGPVKVLIVDNDELLRDLFRVTLEIEDEIVVAGEAEDGVEAVEKTRELLPDVILMDLAMPRLNGIDAITRIRSFNRTVRIIFFSGGPGSPLADEAIRAGADYCLEKPPSDFDHMIELIRGSELDSG
jgi:two-component system, chemotaxis family, chemotaxis protein CheY